MVRRLVACLAERSEEKAERFVNEATETSDAGWNNVANHPKEQETERVREVVGWGKAQATLAGLREVEVRSKQMRGKKWAK
jgi:hypothetical protein